MTTINQNKHFELCPICGAPVAEAHPAYGNKHGQTRPYTCGHGHLVEILYKDGEYHPRYGEDIMELLNETNIKNTIKNKPKKVAGKNDIISTSKVVVGYCDEISLSYFRDGTLLVSRNRYHPVTTMMTVHIARPTEEGKRRAVAYVLQAMSEVLQDEDVNEELDI